MKERPRCLEPGYSHVQSCEVLVPRINGNGWIDAHIMHTCHYSTHIEICMVKSSGSPTRFVFWIRELIQNNHTFSGTFDRWITTGISEQYVFELLTFELCDTPDTHCNHETRGIEKSKEKPMLPIAHLFFSCFLPLESLRPRGRWSQTPLSSLWPQKRAKVELGDLREWARVRLLVRAACYSTTHSVMEAWPESNQLWHPVMNSKVCPID